jgi:hypothetical protein
MEASEELERNVALKFLPDLLIQDAALVSNLKEETGVAWNSPTKTSCASQTMPIPPLPRILMSV